MNQEVRALDSERKMTIRRVVVAAIVIAVVAGLAARAAAPPRPHAHRELGRHRERAGRRVRVCHYAGQLAEVAIGVRCRERRHRPFPRRGEQVTEDFVVAGRKGRVVWTVRKRDAPREWIIEGDVDGREAGVITYALTPVAEGTRFDRELVYGSPNLLFAVLNRISVRARVEAESAQAVQNLKRLLEAARDVSSLVAPLHAKASMSSA